MAPRVQKVADLLQGDEMGVTGIRQALKEFMTVRMHAPAEDTNKLLDLFKQVVTEASEALRDAKDIDED